MYDFCCIKNLLYLFCWIFHRSNCKQKTIAIKRIAIERRELIEAVNESDVISLTPSETQIKAINIVAEYNKPFINDGIRKFHIGTKSIHQRNQLKMCLPSGTTVDRFVQFTMINSKRQFSSVIKEFGDIRDVTLNLDEHFRSTIEFCAYELCNSDEQRVISVGVYRLISLFLSHFKKNEMLELEFHREPLGRNEVPFDILKRIVLFDGYYNGMQLNCLIFIPRNKTVVEFVAECASKVNSTNEFLEMIIKTCESKQTSFNQKIKWSRIIREMKNYRFHPTSNPKLRREPSFGNGWLNQNALSNSICFNAIQKLTIEFNSIISHSEFSNEIEIILDYLQVTVKILREELKYKIAEETLNSFTDLIDACHLKIMQSYYNLLQIPDAKLELVEIEKEKFYRFIKKNFHPMKLLLPISEIPKQKFVEGAAIFKDSYVIEFPHFPYIEEENLNTRELIDDYLKFVSIMIGMMKNYDESIDLFWEKFCDEKTLASYSEYLSTRKFKNSKDFENAEIGYQEISVLSDVHINVASKVYVAAIIWTIFVIFLIFNFTFNQ